MLCADIGFICPHTSDDRLYPFPAVCVVRLCDRVVVFPLIHLLHVMLELLSWRLRGSGGNSPLRDIIASFLRWACPILRCHSCSCCCAAFRLAFSFRGPSAVRRVAKFFLGSASGIPGLVGRQGRRWSATSEVRMLFVYFLIAPVFHEARRLCE